MLDIKYILDNFDYVKEMISYRSGVYDLDSILELDNKRRDILKNAEALKSQKNRVSEEIALKKRNKEDTSEMIAQMKELGERIKSYDSELKELEPVLKTKLASIPNIPDKSVPIGKDDKANLEVRKWNEPKQFDFDFKPHWDIGTNLGILDFEAAAKITGARFSVYRGLGARLERSVYNFMLDLHSSRGYTEILPPYMVNRDSMFGTGQLPKFEDDAFSVCNTNYFMIPTAEVPVTNLHRAEVLDCSELPIYYCAYTACFRSEAGSAGRDTRGLIRQHQFNKVELVKFCLPEKSPEELESLTSEAELILQNLGLPYRVVALSTGDMGFASAKTYDIEVWMPSYGKYVEISSCSNYKDFQARRMNIKYRDKNNKTNFVHTLNGSGLAVGRTVAAILENYQNADGSVTVPEKLKPYMGVDKIKR